MITIPTPTPQKPCIQYRKNIWYVSYRVDGRPKLTSLGTTHFDEAVPLRDSFYEAMLERGAVRSVKKSFVEKVKANPDRYIFQRDPFVVTVDGAVVGSTLTRKAAVIMRDEHLAKL